MSTAPYMHFSFWPAPGTTPTSRLRHDLKTAHIEPTGPYDRQTVQLTLRTGSPDEYADTLRYLRELAAEVTKLADELEQSRVVEHDGRQTGAPVKWLEQHPACDVALRSEYGDAREIGESHA